MSSRNSADLVDLDRDIPTTRDDIRALADARRAPSLPMADYLAWLTEVSRGRMASREVDESRRPFDLARRDPAAESLAPEIESAIRILQAANKP